MAAFAASMFTAPRPGRPPTARAFADALAVVGRKSSPLTRYGPDTADLSDNAGGSRLSPPHSCLRRARFLPSRSTGVEVPKRQAEQLVVRAAEDLDAFYEARRAAEGEPPPEGSVVVLTFDGKGVVLHREDLREATRKAAERRLNAIW